MAGYQLHYNTPEVIEEPRGPQQYLLSQLFSGLWWKIRLIYYLQQLAVPGGEESQRKLCRALYGTEKRIRYVRHELGRGRERRGGEGRRGCIGNVCLSSNFIPPPRVLPQRPKRELAEHGSAYMPRQSYGSKPPAHTRMHKYTHTHTRPNASICRDIKQENPPTLRSVLLEALGKSKAALVQTHTQIRLSAHGTFCT